MLDSVLENIRRYTHQKRAKIFFSMLPDMSGRPLRIIDLGGTVEFWNRWGLSESHNIEVTLVNNHAIDKDAMGYDNSIPYIQETIADVLEIGAETFDEFDLTFSNSMIEHLDSWESQVLIGRNITNSCRPYFIQIPNKWSPIDPHFPNLCVPFFGAYGKSVQARLLMLNGFGGGRRASTLEQGRERVRYYNPLGLSQMRTLFPDADIIAEKTLGFAPSLIATRDLVSGSD